MLTRGRSVFTPEFSYSTCARLRPVCRFEAGFGTSFRYSVSHTAVPGPIPPRSKHKIPGPERGCVSGMVSHPRTRHVRGSLRPHAGGLRLLLVPSPDRISVLRSGSQLISAISSKAQAIFFLRGRSSRVTPRSFWLEAEPLIAAAPRGHP